MFVLRLFVGFAGELTTVYLHCLRPCTRSLEAPHPLHCPVTIWHHQHRCWLSLTHPIRIRHLLSVAGKVLNISLRWRRVN